MPLFALLAVNLCLGALASLAAARELRASPRAVHSTRAFRALALHELIVAMPVAAFLLVRFADWTVSYLVDGARLPSALVLLAVLLHGVLGVGGFALGARLVREHRTRWVGGLAGVVLFGVLVVAFVLRNRVAQVGTYVQYRSGFGVAPLWNSGLLGVGAPLALAWTLAAAHLLWALWKRL